MVQKLRLQEAKLLAKNTEMTIEKLALRLGFDGKKEGNDYICSCPVHTAANSYLHLSPSIKQKNRTFIRCVKGCRLEDILKAGNLAYADLSHSEADYTAITKDPIFQLETNKLIIDDSQLAVRICSDIDYILDWASKDAKSAVIQKMRSVLKEIDSRE